MSTENPRTMILHTYAYVIDPVNLVGSVSPNVSSPFVTGLAIVGSKDTETRLDGIAPLLKRLSVTVGTLAFVAGCRAPMVWSTRPILQNTAWTYSKGVQ